MIGQNKVEEHNFNFKIQLKMMEKLDQQLHLPDQEHFQHIQDLNLVCHKCKRKSLYNKLN